MQGVHNDRPEEAGDSLRFHEVFQALERCTIVPDDHTNSVGGEQARVGITATTSLACLFRRTAQGTQGAT